MSALDLVWSVFVGGTEVNDYYLTLSQAEELADDYEEDGYDEIYLVSTDGEEIMVKE